MAGPGNKKRKVAGVGIDFKRAKHKVGKRLPPARNATDTTVRSRVISLPSQSVAADKGTAAVSERNLTLKVCTCCAYEWRDKLSTCYTFYSTCLANDLMLFCL